MILNDDLVGAISMKCDECGDLLGSDFNDDAFRDMIDHAKAAGWNVTWEDIKGEWTHTCPTCSDAPESRLERAKRVLGQR